MQDLSTHFKKPITHYVVAVFPFFPFPFCFNRTMLRLVYKQLHPTVLHEIQSEPNNQNHPVQFILTTKAHKTIEVIHFT